MSYRSIIVGRIGTQTIRVTSKPVPNTDSHSGCLGHRNVVVRRGSH